VLRHTGVLCSEWFDFFDGTRLVNMSDTDLYKEDWIGLRRLDEAGGVFRGQVWMRMGICCCWMALRCNLHPMMAVAKPILQLVVARSMMPCE
jgi:Palmitoyl protein thioesterase